MVSSGQSSAAIAPETRGRIDLLRVVLIYGIVLLHTPPAIAPSDTRDGVFEFLNYALSNGLFRGSVPLLTAISGFLLYHGSKGYGAVLRSKARRLLVPFVIWNLPLVVILFALQHFGLVGEGFRLSLAPFDAWTFLNASFALTQAPVNYALFFLRDLFVIVVMSPVLVLLVRRAPLIGLLVVLLVFQANLDGPLVLRNSMVGAFYLGLLLAHSRVDPHRWDRLWPLAAVAIAGSASLIAWFGLTSIEWFRLVSPILIWIAVTPVCRTSAARFVSRQSGAIFFVFLAHAPVLIALALFVRGPGGEQERFALWLLTPPVVTVGLLLAYRALQTLLPNVARFVTGQGALGRRPASRPMVEGVQGKADGV